MSEFAESKTGNGKPREKIAKRIDQYKDFELVERSALMTSVRSLGSRIRSGIMGIPTKQNRQAVQPRRSSVVNQQDQTE